LLTFVPTPIGNLEDISFRALEALKRADVILAEDTRVIKKLLSLLSQKYGIDFGQKRIFSFHEHNQEEFLQKIDPSIFEDKVVYVSDAGMPGISDPGAALVRYVKEHGIDYTVLPGPSAFSVAWVASGYEGPFCFYGFLPHKKGRKELLQRILQSSNHSILYEAPHRLLKLLEEIVALDPERQLFLAKELTKKFESYYEGSSKELLDRLKKEQIKGEWVVIITPAKEPRLKIDIAPLLELDMPKKELAKLISKLTGESVGSIYEKLIKS